MAREFVVRDAVVVSAPVERLFQLSTCIELVERVLGMNPVRGRTTGLVAAGDTVLWRGWKFGLPVEHESLIDGFEPPVFFRDRMIAGRFAAFEHEHRFTERGDGTVEMRDELRFTMPWGRLGEGVGRWVMTPHVERLLRRRFALLKRLAEGEEWRAYLRQPGSGGA